MNISRFLCVAVLLMCAGGVPSVLLANPLYVSSFGSGEVLRYDSATGDYIGTFAAAGSSGGLLEPHGVLDRGVDVLVASAQTDQVLRYDRQTGAYLGEFIGPASGIDYPVYMAVGPDGLLYVSSQGNDSIRRFDAFTGEAVDVFVGSGVGGLDGPSGFAFANNQLYVAGRYSGNVVAYDATTGASLTTVLDSSDGLTAGTTFGLQVDGTGDLYVASNGAVRRWNASSATLTDFATGFPIGIEPHPDGGLVVATGGNLRRIDSGTNSLSDPLLGSGGTINTLNFFHYSSYAGVPGDYNNDGTVNLADYTVWRDSLGSPHSLGGNGFELGPSNGIVDQSDYWLWKRNFGQQSPTGSAVGLHLVAEPGSSALLGLLITATVIHWQCLRDHD